MLFLIKQANLENFHKSEWGYRLDHSCSNINCFILRSFLARNIDSDLVLGLTQQPTYKNYRQSFSVGPKKRDIVFIGTMNICELVVIPRNCATVPVTVSSNVSNVWIDPLEVRDIYPINEIFEGTNRLHDIVIAHLGLSGKTDITLFCDGGNYFKW